MKGMLPPSTELGDVKAPQLSDKAGMETFWHPARANPSKKFWNPKPKDACIQDLSWKGDVRNNEAGDPNLWIDLARVCS